ncbi:MAG: FadR family transcriptional regulator [Clostridia bacterium]|nr:FadR family transcriptional regulator [Clostridia bacterium]
MPRKKSNTSLVREYIRNLIVSQGLKSGDMLPCEGDIAAALDISKSSVREATHALESIGLIEIRHGIGLVLRDFNLDAIGDIFDYSFVLDPSIVLDLYDLRQQLESSLMPRIVERVQDIHFDRCESILAEWELLADAEESTYEVDRQFHETLYSVVDNRMLTKLCHIFWNTFRDLELTEQLRRGQPKTIEGTHKIIQDHRRILEAVRARDSELASRLMFSHFSRIERLNFDTQTQNDRRN